MENLMLKPWFEKHRPTSLDEVVFESPDTENRIKAFVQDGYIQGNIISYGPGGVGKTTINKILAYAIVKHKDDLFVLKKGVDSVEELKSWLLDAPIASKQRIVICEEFDQLSREAQTALKNGLMENYMPKVAYIVTTNNIHKIDAALLQRFNIKLNFTAYDINGCYFRMRHILDKEGMQYDENEVYQLVNSFRMKGIRELINNIQLGCIDGHFKLSNIPNGVSTSGVEDTIISYIKFYISVINASVIPNTNTVDIEKIYKICTTPTEDPHIKDYYLKMLQLMETYTGTNYDYIFSTLVSDPAIILPLKNVLIEYYQKLNLVPIPGMHLQSCLFEIFATLYTIMGGDKKLIH